MKIQPISFNIYLLLVSLFLAGCETTDTNKPKKETTAKAQKKDERKPKKEFATVRFHLETNLDGTSKTKVVPVYRANPVYIAVEELVFLDEGSVDMARVLEWQGTYAIQLKFNPHGSLYLDSLTTSNKGKRLVIYSEFGQSKDVVERRWLAAPVIENRVDTGIITFTPDASREEAERIVNGLNNVAKMLKKRLS